jgi:hypothetical protein
VRAPGARAHRGGLQRQETCGEIREFAGRGGGGEGKFLSSNLRPKTQIAPEKAAAACPYLGGSEQMPRDVRTLKRWRDFRRGLCFLKIGGRYYYTIGALREFHQSSIRGTLYAKVAGVEHWPQTCGELPTSPVRRVQARVCGNDCRAGRPSVQTLLPEQRAASPGLFEALGGDSQWGWEGNYTPTRGNIAYYGL